MVSVEIFIYIYIYRGHQRYLLISTSKMFDQCVYIENTFLCCFQVESGSLALSFLVKVFGRFSISIASVFMDYNDHFWQRIGDFVAGLLAVLT